jgi:hypothetical protein
MILLCWQRQPNEFFRTQILPKRSLCQGHFDRLNNLIYFSCNRGKLSYFLYSGIDFFDKCAILY